MSKVQLELKKCPLDLISYHNRCSIADKMSKVERMKLKALLKVLTQWDAVHQLHNLIDGSLKRDFIFMVIYGHIPQNGHKTSSLYN